MAEPDISAICRQAVLHGRQAGEEFDYMPESISGLERILNAQNSLYKQGRLTEIYIWNLSVMMGVYLGQTLMHCGLRDRGYSWMTDDEGVPLLADGLGRYVSPIYKVRQRILGGAGENVREFFEDVLDAVEEAE